MKRKIRQSILNIIVMGGLTIVAWSLIIQGDWAAILNHIIQAKIEWLGLAFVMILLTFIIEGLILKILTRLHYPNYGFWDALVNAMVGVFFNGITPSATGGQFAQGYVMVKQKVDLGSSISVLTMNFIISQIALILLASMAFIFFYPYFQHQINQVVWLGIRWNFIIFSIIGFGINIIVVLAIIIAVYAPFIHQTIKRLLIWFGKQFKLIKNLDSWIHKYEEQIKKITDAFQELRKNTFKISGILLLHLLKLALLYSIPFILSLGFGFPWRAIRWWESLNLASFLNMIVSYFPVPGASGGTEAFFVIIFNRYYGTTLKTSSVLMIWRFLTFYLGMLLGLSTFILFGVRHKKNRLESNAISRP